MNAVNQTVWTAERETCWKCEVRLFSVNQFNVWIDCRCSCCSCASKPLKYCNIKQSAANYPPIIMIIVFINAIYLKYSVFFCSPCLTCFFYTELWWNFSQSGCFLHISPILFDFTRSFKLTVLIECILYWILLMKWTLDNTQLSELMCGYKATCFL